MPDLFIRYQAIIEQRDIYTHIPFPPYAVWRFSGDNRSPHNPGTSRVQATVRIDFADRTANLDKKIGATHRWTCSTFGPSGNCWDPATDTASFSTLVLAPGTTVGSQAATLTIMLNGVTGKNPLFPNAPPIDAQMGVHVRPGNSYFTAHHERMPTHVLMWGFAESEYHISYVSHAAGPWCLYNSPSSAIPGRRAKSVVQF